MHHATADSRQAVARSKQIEEADITCTLNGQQTAEAEFLEECWIFMALSI
jgi:hypothetical protein